mgnify:CR=1 FL=1|tara:strand:+ start:483 stop:839 length:357 start_codon:yes stop_codon:yes gene_type:complete
MKKYWVYINGYKVVVAKIGYKWVKYKSASLDQKFTKIKRSTWDKGYISTLDEANSKSKIYKNARDLGVSLLKKTKIRKDHPTRKFGWEFKTLEELLAETKERADLNQTYLINLGRSAA